MKSPTSEEIQIFLDHAIIQWRIIRDARETSKYQKKLAECYIDAYQSTRISLLGEQLLYNDKVLD